MFDGLTRTQCASAICPHPQNLDLCHLLSPKIILVIINKPSQTGFCQKHILGREKATGAAKVEANKGHYLPGELLNKRIIVVVKENGPEINTSLLLFQMHLSRTLHWEVQTNTKITQSRG